MYLYIVILAELQYNEIILKIIVNYIINNQEPFFMLQIRVPLDYVPINGLILELAKSMSCCLLAKVFSNSVVICTITPKEVSNLNYFFMKLEKQIGQWSDYLFLRVVSSQEVRNHVDNPFMKL